MIVKFVSGQGIGKNSDGIVKPVKANLKFDNAGLGHDKAKEFTDQWWQKAFNDAANNIKVNSNPDNVSLSVENKDSVEVVFSLKFFFLFCVLISFSTNVRNLLLFIYFIDYNKWILSKAYPKNC